MAKKKRVKKKKKKAAPKAAATQAPASKAPTPTPGAPKARKRTRDARRGMTTPTSAPPDDRTLLKAGTLLEHGGMVPEVQLIRPVWKDGHMIVRPLPTWNPEQPGVELDPCRRTAEAFGIYDWMREVTAVYFWGTDDDAVTFLLHDKENATEDEIRHNPATILFKAVDGAANPDRRTSQSEYIAKWAKLLKGRKKIISKPTSVLYFGGLVFKRGTDVYFGKDALRAPIGLADDDLPPIIQLKGSARYKDSLVCRVKSAMGALNPAWEGEQDDWENVMFNGDWVGPENGRFLTIFNPKAEPSLRGGVVVDDDDDGEFGIGGQASDATGGADSSPDIEGYDIRLDKCLHRNGKLLKKTAALVDGPRGPALTQAKKQIIFFDDILRFPSVDEQCLMIARALRGHREMVEFGWQRHPEFLTEEVQKVLANATQVMTGGAIPQREPAAEDEDDEFMPQEQQQSATVPVDEELEEVEAAAAADDDEYEEVEVEEGAEAEGDESEYEEIEEVDAEGGEDEEAAAEETEEAEAEAEEVEEAEGEEVEGEEVEGEEVEGEEVEGDEDEYEYVEEEVEVDEAEGEEAEGDEDEYEYIEEEVEVDEEEEAAEATEETDSTEDYEDADDIQDEEYEEADGSEPEAEAEEAEVTPEEAAENDEFQDLAAQAEERSAARAPKKKTGKKKVAPKPPKKKVAPKPAKKAAPAAAPKKKVPTKKAPPSRKKKKSS